MGSEDMEEKDMAPAVPAEEVAAPGEEGAVKQEESIGDEEGELLVKSAPNDELNSKTSHDIVPGDVDVGESVVAVAGSVDTSVEGPVSAGAEPNAVSDPATVPSRGVVDATEKVESWDLSEAVAKNVQDGDEKEDLKPKISEAGSPEGVDTQDAPVVSIDSIEDSVGGEPVSVSSDVEDKAEDSEHAGGVTEVPSEIAGSEDVSPGIPAEGSAEKVESEAVDVPVEEIHEVVEATTSAEPDKESASLEAVPSPSDDVEEKSAEVNFKGVGEVASILPSESADDEGESSEIPAEGPSENVGSEALEAPVDCEGLESEAVHEVVEPTTSAEADAGSAEPEAVPSPSDNVEEKSVEVNSEDTREANTVLPSDRAENEDVSPELPAEGPSDNVGSEALEAPVDSEGLESEAVHEVVEPTTSAEADAGSAAPESLSAHVDVEEKSVEVNSEDTSEADRVLPSESAENEGVSPELPAEGSVDNIGSEALEALEAPVDSEGLEPEAVHEVEPTTSAEADAGSAEPEAVPSPSDNVEEKSVEVNSEDTREANTVLPSDRAENEDVSPELPAEGSVDNVGSEALEAPVDSEGLEPEAVHEVEPTTSAEADAGLAEREAVPSPSDNVEEKSVEVNSEDTSEADRVLPSVSAEIEGVSPELPAEGSVDNVGSEALEALEAPVDSEGLEPEAIHEVVEPTTSAEADAGSAAPESLSAHVDVEEKSVEVNSEDTSEADTVLPSESAGNEDVSPELPAEGSVDNVGSEALEAPVDSEGLESEAVHEVVEPTTSAEADAGSAAPESLSAHVDVEEKSVEVNSEDTSEADRVLPSESAENEGVSPELPAEGSVDNVGSEALEALEAPVDSEGLEPEAVHEVVEPTTSAEADAGSAEPEAVPSPSDNVEEKSVEVNSEDTSEADRVLPSESAGNEDVSPELPAEGSVDNVGSEALEAPVDSEGLEPEAIHEVVEPTTSAEADAGSAEPEAVPSPSDNVEEKSVEVNSEDTSEVDRVLPSESAGNEDVSPELPAEGSVDNVGSKALYGPVEEVHEVVEATISAEPDEESAEQESVSAPPDDVEDKSIEVNSRDVNEATTALENSDNEVTGSELPAEESAANVSNEALEPEAVHEMVTPTTSAEADEESAEPESVSAPDHVDDKSLEVNSEDTSEAVTVLPLESDDNEVASSELPADKSALIGEIEDTSIEAKPDEESTESESVSAPPGEERSVNVKSEDVTEAIIESESADDEVVSSELPAEESTANVSSDALDAQALQEVVEPTTSGEPVEESAEPESLSAPSDNVEDKSIDVGSEDVTAVTTASESANNEDVSPEPSAEEPSDDVEGVALYAPVEEVHEIVEVTISAEPNEESLEPESVPAPSDDVEDKSVAVSLRDLTEASTESESADNEIVIPELPAEGSGDNVRREALEPEAVHEVAEPTGAEPDEESAEPESVAAPDDVEDKSFEVPSEDTSEAATVLPSESADNGVVSPELPAEASADKVDAPVEEIGKIEDAATNAKPDEVSASLESVAAPPDDAQRTPEEVEPEVSAPEMEESIMAISTPLPAEEELFDLLEYEHGQSEVSHEGSAENGIASIGVDTVTDTKENDAAGRTSEESFGGATSGDVPDNPQGLSSEEPSGLSLESHEESLSAEDGVALVDRCIRLEELPQESAAESQRSVSMDVEVNAGDEEGIAEGGDIIKEQSPEPQSVSANGDLSVEDVSHLLQNEITDEEAAHEATQPVEDVSHLLQTEMTDEEAAHEATQPVEDVSHLLQTEMTDEEAAHVATQPVEDASHLLQTVMTDEEAAHVATQPFEDVSPQPVEDVSPQPVEDVSHLLQSEMTDEEAAHVATQPVEDASHLLQTVMTDEEAAHVATQPFEDVSPQPFEDVSPQPFEDVSPQPFEDVSPQPVEDVSHLLQSEMTDEEAAHVASLPVEDVSHLLQTVMTDEEVKLAAAHHSDNSVAPEESVEDETPALESENAHGESSIPRAEASGAPQTNEVETVSREFNFNDFSEAPTTSEVVRKSGDESHDAGTSEQVTPYLVTALATAIGEKGNSSDAAGRDTTPLEISSPPPVVESEMAPRSYNLDEVAINLHDAAEKTFEDAKSSNIGDRQTSVAQSVAQIVLDESSKTGDSSEYISGVVQHVAQLAQDAGQSDPNILPDTVARVFDGETASSPANEASQTKETTSLGTMVSLFIVWCVSLCASRISSKDMPAPALKLAAEEVAAVLHSNAPSQPAPPHEAASSNH